MNYMPDKEAVPNRNRVKTFLKQLKPTRRFKYIVVAFYLIFAIMILSGFIAERFSWYSLPYFILNMLITASGLLFVFLEIQLIILEIGLFPKRACHAGKIYSRMLLAILVSAPISALLFFITGEYRDACWFLILFLLTFCYWLFLISCLKKMEKENPGLSVQI